MSVQSNIESEWVILRRARCSARPEAGVRAEAGAWNLAVNRRVAAPAVAGKILGNAWPAPDIGDLVKPTTFAQDESFYRSLKASTWQVEHMPWGDDSQYPISQILYRVPVYA